MASACHHKTYIYGSVIHVMTAWIAPPVPAPPAPAPVLPLAARVARPDM
jgi:hypothetical protein